MPIRPGTNRRQHSPLRYATATIAACVLLLPAIFAHATTYAGAAPTPAFSIRSLGYLPAGTQSFATGINARGDVSGYGETYRTHYPRYSRPDVAFVFTKGRLVKLGLPPGSQQSFADGLNDRGQIAATAERADHQGHLMAYVVTLSNHGPIWTKLPEPSGPYPYGSPSAINNSGDIAGQSPAVGNSHAAVWLPKGGRYVLDRSWLPLSNLSFMNGIDNSGDVVGTDNGTFTHQVRKPLLWLGPVHQPLDLGCSQYTAGIHAHCVKSTPGEALAVVRGHTFIYAVGTTSTSIFSVGLRAVLWSYSTVDVPLSSPNDTILPLLKGYKLCKADAVNDKGWIVGEMDTFSGDYARQAAKTQSARRLKGSLQSGPAVLWLNHTVYNLNRLIPQHSGWNLLQATGINASGQIVGNGAYKGRQTAFLLTPK